MVFDLTGWKLLEDFRIAVCALFMHYSSCCCLVVHVLGAFELVLYREY